MNRSLSVLVALVFFLFGAGALYVLASRGIIVVNPQLSPSPTVLEVSQRTPTSDAALQATASPSLAPTSTSTPDQKTTIEGTLGYPSEGIPPLEVFAINTVDSAKTVSVTTAANISTFSLSVEPGTYHVVAYPVGNDSFAGGYTKAVACGLSVECTDHSLVSVQVAQGKTVSNVEVKDWYAPAGTFPSKP